MKNDYARAMYQLGRIQATYGQSLNGLMRPAAGVQMATYPLPGHRLGYAMLLPNIGDGRPYWIPAYDAMQTEEMVSLLHQQFSSLQMVSPAAEFDLRASADRLIREFKTKKRWLLSSALQVQERSLNVSSLHEFLAFKRRSYPEAHLTHEDYLRSNGYVGYALDGSIEDQWLFTILVYHRGLDVVASHVILTFDPAARKKYSPYVLAHASAIRWAESAGGTRLRCGSYYPYKAIFGVEPTYYPLIPSDTLTPCGNLFEQADLPHAPPYSE